MFLGDCKDEDGKGRCVAGAINNYTTQLLTYKNDPQCTFFVFVVNFKFLLTNITINMNKYGDKIFEKKIYNNKYGMGFSGKKIGSVDEQEYNLKNNNKNNTKNTIKQLYITKNKS